MSRYFSMRRLNPYRGVVLIVETEGAEAHSFDGLTWHLRGDDGYGWVRPTGIWVEGKGLQAGAGRQHEALLAALAARPDLPFPRADSLELWLLDKDSGLPLALLDSQRPSRGPTERFDNQWYPFVPSYLGFRSPALAAQQGEGGQPGLHRDYLARLVNQAARPLPAAQWFRRHKDGSAEGLGGLRLSGEWEGRGLPAEAFPELLVRAGWNNLLEQSVIKDYHAWLAALLLPWPDLSDATRRWLEAAACQRPQALARIYRLLPRRLDAARLEAALVAARLEQSAGSEAAQDDMY
jgi:hypothetical protein